MSASDGSDVDNSDRGEEPKSISENGSAISPIDERSDGSDSRAQVSLGQAAPGAAVAAKMLEEVHPSIADGAVVVANVLDKFQQAIADFLRREDVARFVARLPEVLVQIATVYERIQQLPSDVHQAFFEAGFPPSARLTMPELAQIQEAHQRSDSSFIATFIEDRCGVWIFNQEHREHMLQDWESSPLLTRRMPILRESVESASQERFAVATAALVPQFEGVIADGFAVNGKMGGGLFRSHVNTLAGRDPLYGSLLSDFVIKIFLADFGHNTPLSVELSRHAIAHGRDVDFGTRRNAVRIIMLIDYAQTVFRHTSSALTEAT